MNNCVFTIVAKNYIGLAQILEESFKEKNPETDFFIFVADNLPNDLKADELSDNIIITREKLNITHEKWLDMSFKYDLTEFCTSIKPAAFRYFLDNTNYEKIIYLDPDIYIYSSLNPIFEMLEKHSIVLTPHIVSMQDSFKGERSEGGLMSTGVFNLGFCGIRRSVAAKKMLSWWHERLLEKCYIDSYDSYFTDQKWMDFLPCFFNSEELLVTRHLGMNIAPWNFFERNVFIQEDNLMVCNREGENTNKIDPVLFVHYSGYNYKELKKGNVVQNNIASLTDYSDIKLLTDIYAKAIYSKKELFDKFIAQKYSYGVFDNGDEIKGFHRRVYRSLTNKGEIFDNPFGVGENTLHSLLKKRGMTDTSIINIEKVNKSNLPGIDKKLKLFNVLSRLCYKVIGFEKYLLLIRLLRSFSRYESQIHIIDNCYDDSNIKY